MFFSTCNIFKNKVCTLFAKNSNFKTFAGVGKIETGNADAIHWSGTVPVELF